MVSDVLNSDFTRKGKNSIFYCKDTSGDHINRYDLPVTRLLMWQCTNHLLTILSVERMVTA